MSNKPCPSCAQGTLFEKRKRFLFSYNGHKYWIPDVKVEICDACSEEIIEAKEIRKMEEIAKGKFEKRYADKFFVKIEPASVSHKQE